jgi:hypothetical protein
MAFLLPPPPVKRGPSVRIIAMWVVAGAVVGVWLRGPAHEAQQPHVVIRPPAAAAAAPEAQPTALCSEADGTIPVWGNRNGIGIAPRDLLHFLPRCDGGQ